MEQVINTLEHSKEKSILAPFLAGAAFYAAASTGYSFYQDQSCSALSSKEAIATEAHRTLLVPVLAEGAITGKPSMITLYPYAMARNLSDRLNEKYALQCR